MEEITTIFVVGFPEDFKEREFQNMFTFCAGFEAATLKRPSADDLKVPEDGLLGVVTPISGNSRDGSEVDGPTATSVGLSASGVLNVEASSPQLKAPISDPSASPSLPMVTTTSAPEDQLPPVSSSSLLNGSIPNPRKPIIGFAKFRTRMDAMEALEVLNGRKVDAERNCILKAEIAKKNLHTRRGLVSSDSVNSVFSTTGVLYSNPNISTAPISTGHVGAASFAASMSPTDSTNYLQQQPAYLNTATRYGNEAASATLTQGHSPGSYEQYLEAMKSPTDPSRYMNGSEMQPAAPAVNRSISFSAAASTTLATTTMQPPPQTSMPAAAAAFQAAQMVHRTASTSAGMQPSLERTYLNFKQRSMSEAVSPGPMSPPGHSPMTMGSPLSGMYAPTGMAPNGTLMSPPPLTPRNQIPADQNPPCNTLYVGNLPPNASEEELRRLFARQRGYKRLCFRPKPGTGPMCFVEFDDVYCATRALNELYGTLLSNSVKGGIRLSYSKNPLGVRQTLTGQSQQQSNGSNMFNSGGAQPSLKVVTTFGDNNGYRPNGPFSATTMGEGMFSARSASVAGPLSAGMEHSYPNRTHSFAADGNYGPPGVAPGLARPPPNLYPVGDRSSMGTGHSLLQALRANASVPPNLGSIEGTLSNRPGIPSAPMAISPPVSGSNQHHHHHHQQQQQQHFVPTSADSSSTTTKDINPTTNGSEGPNSMRWLMETII